MRPPKSLLAPLLLLLPALLACPADPPSHFSDRVSLVETLETAQIEREVRHIDLGTPEGRPHLEEGWSWDEQGDGMTFVWATGPQSALTFYLAAPRPLRATLRCFPFPFEGAPDQAFEIELNGHHLPSQPLRRGPTDLAFELPESALVAGKNRLELRPAYHRSAAELGLGDDRRSLSAGCDFLRLGGAHEAPAPSALRPAEGPRLLVPFGSQVSYFLPLTQASTLEFSAVRFEGEGTLEVLLQPEEGQVVPLLEPNSDQRNLQLDLTATGLAAVVLRAHGGNPKGEDDTFQGAVLDNPLLYVPQLSTEAASTHTGAESSNPQPGQRPNIALYLVDTLRADVLGCYGHDQPTSPHLDAFAQDALLFENARAQSPWTRPSVASLLTGRDPLDHGTDGLQKALPESLPNLAESLRQAGYHTAAFVANAHITPETGFDHGFDHFHYAPEDAEKLTDLALQYLETQTADDDDRPFFLYVHTIDPHAPYEPPEDLRRRFAPEVTDPYIGSFQHLRDLGHKRADTGPQTVTALRALYDAEVAANDLAFGTFLERLDTLAPPENTAVGFLSDHGDAFHERQVFGHGWDLYGEVLDIPLVLRLPGIPGGRRLAEPVQHADLFPTLLALAGEAVSPYIPGRNLLPWLRGEAPLEATPLVSHMDYEGRAALSVELNGYKLHYPLSADYSRHPRLYHRTTDPSEQEELSSDRSVRAGYLATLARQRLAEAAQEGTEAQTIELGEETRKQLEALGYIQ